MGGLQAAEAASLERLKALDSLPDVASQLAEANQLCTHPARADMVSKWLLGKLKTSPEHKTDHAAWQTLLSAFRILSPERLASLLTSGNFFSTLDSALENNEVSNTLVNSITDVVHHLFQVSAGSTGKSFEAVLNLPAVNAASLFGNWLRALAQNFASERTNPIQQNTILSQAFQLWDARKPSDKDNSLFAKHCLIPAALLLSLHLNQSDTTSIKRKRSYEEDGEETGRGNYAQQKLEVLLARHIFLPARSSFFTASESSNPSNGQFALSQLLKSPLKISELLEPLKQSISSNSQTQKAMLSALPLLLDIAIRSIATPTLRQQTKERPWIEAVFGSLHDCNKSSTGTLLSIETLVAMIETVGKRVTLSTKLRKDLFLSHSNLGDGDKTAERAPHLQDVPWNLISQLIALDAGVFCEPLIAEKLFGTVTKAIAEMPRYEGKRARCVWLDDIVVPIMNAFARNRDFETFLRIWRLSLVQARDKEWSVWTHIDRDVEATIQDTLTEFDIVKSVKNLSTNIFSGLRRLIPSAELEVMEKITGSEFEDVFSYSKPDEELNPAESLIELGPNLIILDTILRGLTGETLLDAVRTACEMVFELLMRTPTMVNIASSPDIFCTGQTSRVWSLMLKLYDIWFPSWAAAQERSVVRERVLHWHSGFAIPTAFALFRWDREATPDSEMHIRAVTDAECFIFRMYLALAPFKGYLDPEAWALHCNKVQGLAGEYNTPDSRVFIQYGPLLDAAYSSNSYGQAVDAYVSIAVEHSDKQSMDKLLAFAAGAVAFKQTKVIEQFVEITVRSIMNLDPRFNEDYLLDRVSKVMDVVSSTLADSLSRDQRERILNALVSEESMSRSPTDEQFQKQLAVMVVLMEKPNATAKLSKDPLMIWRLLNVGRGGSQAQAADPASSTHQNATTIALLEELGTLLIKHLLATQDQERSRAFLDKQSETVKQMLHYLLAPERLSNNLAGLALSKAIMRELEIGSKPNLRAQLSHRGAWVMKEILDSCQAVLEDLLQKERPPTELELNEIDVVADLFNEAMKVCSALSGFDLRLPASRLVSTISRLVDVEGFPQQARDSFTARLVRCYSTACRHTSSNESMNLIESATLVMANTVQPQDTEIMLVSYSEYLKTLDSVSKLQLLLNLLHRLSKFSALIAFNVRLLQRCIFEVKKEDFNSIASPEPILYHVLPRLLEIASEGHDLVVHQEVTACIITVLKTKPFLTNQDNIEKLLVTASQLLDTKIGLSIIFMDVCRIISTLLSSHRARLHGRFHLVNQVFQKLITVLFTDKTRFKDARSKRAKARIGKPLDSTHAHTLSRLLVLFCEPLTLSSHSKTSELVDEGRKEQAYVGRYVQHTLHHYCAQILLGAPAAGTKEALTPGIWAMIDAVRVGGGGEDGMKALAAAMDNNERAILRGLYEEWKRFGKWRGG